ncbi:hypothetical protein OQ252_12460 [Acetobacter farinalis]|uniref:Uncharacterized protein n=1 Tax=Acetobacter farinalis TaxID=1260984 RepID=A0ABT3QAD1_9PROT|nr:hypothetical protein [Acetobacter farinalis]MCX2562201.1 hypothetical protein [Acetobacter farinalis]NHO30817.1 hypothetical protein [Acetobacter farinalis]
MADSKKLAPWLDQRFENMAQARQKRFEQPIEKHEAKKEAARHKIEQLSALLNTKNHKLKHQAPINSSRPRNLTSFPAPNPQTKHPTSDTPSPL